MTDRDSELKPRVTGTDLAQRGLEALDVTDYEKIPVEMTPVKGEINAVDWMKIMELGKALAGMKDGMPEHVRGKWGIGCRIAAHAAMWHMDPFSIADQTYVVGNRLGYMSQLIHARVNQGAPLMHRLSCEYTGEGDELVCIVRGQFISGDEREYETPKLGEIKIKNSPLWKADPKQQLWYFAVRAWARKWVPEVIFGLYTREELETDKSLGYEDTAPGLHARLKGSAPGDEGHKVGHAVEQLDQIENGGKSDETVPAAHARERGERVKARVAKHDSPKTTGRTSGAPKGKAKHKQDDTVEKVSRETKDSGTAVTAVTYPSNVAEYLAYARRWIKAEPSKVILGER